MGQLSSLSSARPCEATGVDLECRREHSNVDSFDFFEGDDLDEFGLANVPLSFLRSTSRCSRRGSTCQRLSSCALQRPSLPSPKQLQRSPSKDSSRIPTCEWRVGLGRLRLAWRFA